MPLSSLLPVVRSVRPLTDESALEILEVPKRSSLPDFLMLAGCLLLSVLVVSLLLAA